MSRGPTQGVTVIMMTLAFVRAPSSYAPASARMSSLKVDKFECHRCPQVLFVSLTFGDEYCTASGAAVESH